MKTVKVLVLSVLLVCFSSLVGCSATSSGTSEQISITYFGHAMVSIMSAKGTEILIDPAEPGSFQNIAKPPESITPSAVVVTHEHADHNFVQAEWIKGEPKVFNNIAVSGFSDNEKDEFTPLEEMVDDVKLSTLRTLHASSKQIKDTEKLGSNAAVILEVDGLKVVHLGDSHGSIEDGFTEEQIVKFNNTDVLFMPVGIVMANDVMEAVKALEPKIVVPVHWYSQGYLDSFVKQLEGITVVQKEPTISLSKDSLPESTEIWVMDFVK